MKVDVFKDPVTDSEKTSKKGRLKLVRDAGGSLSTQVEVPATSYTPDDPEVSSRLRNLVEQTSQVMFYQLT